VGKHTPGPGFESSWRGCLGEEAQVEDGRIPDGIELRAPGRGDPASRAGLEGCRLSWETRGGKTRSAGVNTGRLEMLVACREGTAGRFKAPSRGEGK